MHNSGLLTLFLFFLVVQPAVSQSLSTTKDSLYTNSDIGFGFYYPSTFRIDRVWDNREISISQGDSSNEEGFSPDYEDYTILIRALPKDISQVTDPLFVREAKNRTFCGADSDEVSVWCETTEEVSSFVSESGVAGIQYPVIKKATYLCDSEPDKTCRLEINYDPVYAFLLRKGEQHYVLIIAKPEEYLNPAEKGDKKFPTQVAQTVHLLE